MSLDAIEYSETSPFARACNGQTLPSVFGGPSRYVQGNGVIDQAGHYFHRLGMRSSAVLLSRRSQQAEGQRVIESALNAGLSIKVLTFGGECPCADAEIYDVSPELVLVDTGVIASADPRYLSAST